MEVEIDSGASWVNLQTTGENTSSSNTDQTRREERQLLARGFSRKEKAGDIYKLGGRRL